MKTKSALFVMGVLVFCLATPSFAQDEMALFEEIPQVVTSATGRPQELREISNAMTVITAEDIRRSGARNIPDLFYRIPGMQIRKQSGTRYNVAIRDKAANLTNNLLVLVDDVIVFNGIFGGTNWQVIPVALDEIERIEVIRGPGGVLYSSYAVSGVINIITKKGSEGESYAALRVGTQALHEETISVSSTDEKKDKAFRAIYQFHDDEGWNKKYATGKNPNYFTRNMGGVRVDYQMGEDTALMASARMARQSSQAVAAVGGDIKRPGELGAGIVALTRTVSDRYDFKAEVDFTHQDVTAYAISDLNVRVMNFLTQHNFKYDLAGKNVFSLGGQYRYLWGNVAPHVGVNTEDTGRVVSYFFQNEYRPTEKWIFTAGSRIDHNNFVAGNTDEYLWSPRFSGLYVINDDHRVRAAASRSYRTPVAAERDIYGSVGSGISLEGYADLEPERVWMYEVGYQGDYLQKRLSLDVDMYLSLLDDPIILRNLTWPTMRYENNGHFNVFGVEVSGKYHVDERTTLNVDYSYAQPRGYADHAAYQLQDRALEISKHTAGAGVQYTRDKWTFDAYAKYIGKYEQGNSGTGTGAVKMRSYMKGTVRIARAFRFSWMKEDDAEVEFIANDFIGANVHEEPTKYRREMEITAGLKVNF